MRNLVLMFPGQSSRSPGLLSKLSELLASGATLIEAASERLGRDLAHHYRADNAEAFSCNKDVQIGVFLANHLFWQILEEQEIEANASLGLSLGEWNHLVHIGALCFEDALAAVEQRGLAYDAGPRGAMASVFPITLEELQEVADRVQEKGVLEVVNRNSPRQQVLSGATAALEAAMELLEEEHYVEATIIEQQVPMHSSLFAPVAKSFRAFLETVEFNKPRLPYLPNRLAERLAEPTKEQFVTLLSEHVCEPVEWRKSIDLVMAEQPGSILLEVGPKRVLYNLLDRKWHRGVNKLHLDSGEDTAVHLEQTLVELRAKMQEPIAPSS